MKIKKFLAVGLILTLILNMFSMVVFAEKVDDTNKEEICLNLDVSDYTLEKMPDKLKNRINRDKIISLDKSDADDVYSLTVINEDGTKTLTVFSQPIKYIEEETGKVQFIDDSLVASNDGNAYKCITNSNKLYFPKEISKGISLQKGNHKIKITPVVSETKGNEKVKYKKTKINKKDYLQYDNVFGGNTAIQLTPTNVGVKENIVLDKYNGENRFSYIIDAGKLFPRRNEGATIAFVDPKTDLEVLKINEIFVYDATYKGDNATNQNTTCDNYYEIEKLNNGKYLLTMVVDDSFLKSSSTTYPVVVDPTMSWEEEQSAIQYGSIPSDDDFQTSENDGINVGYRYGTNWRTWFRIKNFSRFRHINSNLVVDAYMSVFVNGNSSSLPVKLGTSTSKKSISSSPDRAECFSSTLETIATRTLTRELNFIELDNIFVKWMKTDKESPSINFVPGFVMYTNTADKYAQIVLSEELFNPSLCVKFYEDESIQSNIYYIKNSKHYLCVDDSGNIKFSKELPSTRRNYLWRVLKDNSDGSYIIQSCNNIVSNTNLCLNTDNNKIQLGETGENLVQEWRIVNNFDGTHRIISYYEDVISSNIRTATVNPEYNKLSASNCNFSEYQSWKFVPYTKDVISHSAIKSTSQWPTAKASSSQNLLHGKVPHSIEYKTDGTFLVSGSGVSTPVIRQQATDGLEMSDGSISDYNIDLGRYTLKEYNSDVTIKFVNPDGSYRPKGELYVDVTYNLGSTKTFNSIWFATNTNQNYYTVGAFEVYTSNKLSELYFSKNKIAEFDHSDSIWSGIVNINTLSDCSGKFFGIRITQGVLPQQNNGWLNHSIADTYARIRDIAIFDSNSVTGVQVDNRTVTMQKGTTYNAYATVFPSKATNKNVTWSSSKTSVASVSSNGQVSAIGVGTATITARTVDGNQTANFNVTVKEFCGGSEYKAVSNHDLEIQDDGYYVCSDCQYRIQSPELQDSKVLTEEDYFDVVLLMYYYTQLEVYAEEFFIDAYNIYYEYADSVLHEINVIRSQAYCRSDYEYQNSRGIYQFETPETVFPISKDTREINSVNVGIYNGLYEDLGWIAIGAFNPYLSMLQGLVDLVDMRNSLFEYAAIALDYCKINKIQGFSAAFSVADSFWRATQHAVKTSDIAFVYSIAGLSSMHVITDQNLQIKATYIYYTTGE